MSSYASVRLCGILATCLLGGLLTFGSHAQTAPPMLPTVAFNTLPALQASTPIPGSTHVPGDFNGDGTSDLLWFNPKTSQLNYWTMAATVPQSSIDTTSVTRLAISRTFNVTPGYFVGAVGDFNDDGYADVVFTSANNDLYMWMNDQSGGFTSTKIGTYPSNLQLVGAGDIDGDGYDDLLWVDAADCQFVYWSMHGTTQVGSHVVSAPCGYHPIAVGYFTPTNRISILWTSAANDLIIWDSTGSSFNSYNLSSYMTYIYPLRLYSMGGGYMGQNIGVLAYQNYGEGIGAVGALLSRSFDDQNNQTGVQWNPIYDGGTYLTYPAAYLVEGNGINSTGLYDFDASQAGLYTDGLATANYPSYTGPAGITGGGFGPSWIYPIGWCAVGSSANVLTTVPWQWQWQWQSQ